MGVLSEFNNNHLVQSIWSYARNAISASNHIEWEKNKKKTKTRLLARGREGDSWNKKKRKNVNRQLEYEMNTYTFMRNCAYVKLDECETIERAAEPDCARASITVISIY